MWLTIYRIAVTKPKTPNTTAPKLPTTTPTRKSNAAKGTKETVTKENTRETGIEVTQSTEVDEDDTGVDSTITELEVQAEEAPQPAATPEAAKAGISAKEYLY